MQQYPLVPRELWREGPHHSLFLEDVFTQSLAIPTTHPTHLQYIHHEGFARCTPVRKPLFLSSSHKHMTNIGVAPPNPGENKLYSPYIGLLGLQQNKNSPLNRKKKELLPRKIYLINSNLISPFCPQFPYSTLCLTLEGMFFSKNK